MPTSFVGRAREYLAAGTIADLDMPGFRLHPLKVEYKGYWTVRVRASCCLHLAHRQGNLGTLSPGFVARFSVGDCLLTESGGLGDARESGRYAHRAGPDAEAERQYSSCECVG